MTRHERETAAIDRARALSETETTAVWVYALRLPSGRADYWIRFSERAETRVDGLDVHPVVGYRGGFLIFDHLL